MFRRMALRWLSAESEERISIAIHLRCEKPAPGYQGRAMYSGISPCTYRIEIGYFLISWDKLGYRNSTARFRPKNAPENRRNGLLILFDNLS